MDPAIDVFQKQTRESVERGQALLVRLTPAQFNWRPAPGVWCVAECFDHLNVTNRLYCGQFESAVEEARQKGWTAGPHHRPGAFARWFIRSMEPPVTTKMKAPKVFRPLADLDYARVSSEWVSVHGHLLDIAKRFEPLDVGKAKVPSPAAKFVKMSVGTAFGIIAAHDRRHLWQAEQVMAHPQFPTVR